MNATAKFCPACGEEQEVAITKQFERAPSKQNGQIPDPAPEMGWPRAFFYLILIGILIFLVLPSIFSTLKMFSLIFLLGKIFGG